jgi:transposase
LNWTKSEPITEVYVWFRSTLKVSSSAVAKTIKRYDETGSHEDRHREGRPRVTSAA